MQSCLRCGEQVGVLVGAWIPLCEPCESLLCELPEGYRHDGYCAACGGVKQRNDYVCELCDSLGPGVQEVFCTDCGKRQSIKEVLDAWEVPDEADGYQLPGTAAFCRDCLFRWADRLQDTQLSIEMREKLLELYREEPCLVDRLRMLPLGTHFPMLPPRYGRKLRSVVNSEQIGCADSLLDPEAEELPDHVCAGTAARSCLQAAHSRDWPGRPSDRSVLLWRDDHAMVSDDLDELIAQSSLSDPYTPPLLPVVFDGGKGWFMMAVHRTSKYGRVEVYGTADIQGEAEGLIGPAQLSTTTAQPTPEGLRWIHQQQTALLDWYQRVLLGKRFQRARGRPPGSSDLLRSAQAKYPEAVRAAMRGNRNMRGPLTASDIARELQKLEVDASDRTVRRWLKEGELPAPNDTAE